MENIRSVMDFEFDTRKIQNTHFHQNPEIIYVLEGALELELESETQELQKGEFLLVNANKRHSLRETKKDLLIVSIQINFSKLVEYLGTNQILFWCNSAADKSEAYEQLKKVLDRMLNRYYDKEREGALYLNSIYYEALYLLTSYFMIKADDNRLKEQVSPDNSRVFEIQNYVQANYQKQISLNDLAKKLYLSNAYLSKYIKKRFGLSFLEYVNNIRLFHAVDELLYTEKKITRIALDNGFPTSASFNKAFRDIYHMTPSAYRASVRQEEQENTDGTGQQEEVGQRVKDYLAGNVPVEDTVAARNMSLFTADASEAKEYIKNWCKIINIGRVEALLDSSMQQQVLLMQEELGFTYVRIWNIFVGDMYDADEENGWHYNFSRVDRGLDFLVDHKLKPYIELSFKPIHVSYTINSTLAQKENDIIFHERESYEKVMHDLAAHLINRYGLDEIETWYFELWKDERMNMLDENGWYFDCFEIGYEALKKISPKIRVGGAGFAMGYDRYQYRDLISNWKKRSIRPDFISVYAYSYELIHFYGCRNLIRVGTAGALRPEVKVRDMVFGMGACTTSNYVRQFRLPGDYSCICSYELLDKAVRTARERGFAYHVGNILSSDMFYNPDIEPAGVTWDQCSVHPDGFRLRGHGGGYHRRGETDIFYQHDGSGPGAGVGNRGGGLWRMRYRNKR